MITLYDAIRWACYYGQMKENDYWKMCEEDEFERQGVWIDCDYE
jgi:hypothetical protein